MKLVSAIMPTRGRVKFAKQAVESFIAQTYPNRELIILDDMNDRSFPGGILDLPIAKVPIIYLMHHSKDISEKRNMCCQYSRGEIIAHWDSDDWSAPERLEQQVRHLEESGKAVTGYHSMFFYSEEHSAAYYFKRAMAHYVLGTSLCFTKASWKEHPFHASEKIAEDRAFCEAAQALEQLHTADGGPLMVARIHKGNTMQKNPRSNSNSYRPVSVDMIPKGFFA